jgi:hypothetical protein
MMWISPITCSIVLLSGSLVRAAAPTTAPTQSGRQHLSFTERSGQSSVDEWSRRSGDSIESAKRSLSYDLAAESFEAYIPRGYNPNNPHGLLVFISPGNADLPPDWTAVLDRQKLIWICPNNAGNDRNPLIRIGLAIDAAHNMPNLYSIDPRRMYVCGFSGGGRAASIATVGFPDVFTGGIFMMGCNFYRKLPAGGGKFYPPAAFRPPGDLFELAKQHPLVLITGDGDMNLAQTKANLAGYKQDGFQHVTCMELSGVGHAVPPARSLEKAITLLDSSARATTRTAAGPARR